MPHDHVFHPFDPVWDHHSRILVLGSFPSVKSRKTGFYYGHPQNRFWKVLAAVYNEADVPMSIEARRIFVLKCGVALWDVIQSCDIIGSSDASIRNAVANDLSALLRHTQIDSIFCNGKRAFSLYERYCFPQTGKPAVCLPSTSAANASWSLERLAEAWRVIR